jgi:hypothetical protein
MPRGLTKNEKAAVDQVEKALAAIPDTLALHFNESGFHVFDRSEWRSGAIDRGRFEDHELDHRAIACRYDTGAL